MSSNVSFDASNYQPSFKKFIELNNGTLFNLIFGLITGIVYGFVLTLNKHGYNSTEKDAHCDEEWGMGFCSGRYGPGTAPITITLMIISIVIFVFKLVSFYTCPGRLEMKRREGEMMLQSRLESYRQSEMALSSAGSNKSNATSAAKETKAN
jgi:hypothetical protein